MINTPITIDMRTTYVDSMMGNMLKRPIVSLSDDDELMLESATLEDIELAYLGDTLLVESVGAMFEAITTKRIKLAQTMRAFIRVLNRGLNGTGITAGADSAGSDDSGQMTLGGAVIGKVRRVANIPIMTAQIPLSDGQTTSIIFHSPTAEGQRVKNDDTLVAFQFLVNKRDVTHVVAPVGGRDVTLNQVCQALSNLIERNSGKFQKAKERQNKVKADIESYLNEADKLEDERSGLIGSVEAAQDALKVSRSGLSTLQGKLEKQQALNTELRATLARLQKARNAASTVAQPDSVDNTNESARSAELARNAVRAVVTHEDLTAYSAKEIKAAADLLLLSEIKRVQSITARVNTVIQNADGSDFSKMPPQYELARVAAQFVIYALGGKGDKTAMRKAMGAKIMRIKPETMIARLEKANALLKAAGQSPIITVSEAKSVDAPAPASEPIPTQETPPAPVQEPETVGRYRYALTLRPAAPGAVPAGHAAILPPPDKEDPYSDYTRHGIITYDRELSEQEISQFDLRYLPDTGELSSLAKMLASADLADHAEQYLELAQSDNKMFRDTVRMKFKKRFETDAWPREGSLQEGFIADVTGELAQIVAGQKAADVKPDDIADSGATETSSSAEAGPARSVEPDAETETKGAGEAVTDADKQANEAIEYLKALPGTFTSRDLNVINAEFDRIQQAADTLISAGRYEENELLVGDAADHLIAILAEIQRAGGY